jgi:TRAP-type C4-dicarboxylate transport system substrate-binding protein
MVALMLLLFYSAHQDRQERLASAAAFDALTPAQQAAQLSAAETAAAHEKWEQALKEKIEHRQYLDQKRELNDALYGTPEQRAEDAAKKAAEDLYTHAPEEK